MDDKGIQSVLTSWVECQSPRSVNVEPLGATNDVYRVTGCNEYYLRVYRSSNLKKITQEHELLACLALLNPQVIPPLKAKNGSTLVSKQDTYFALYPKAKGQLVATEYLTESHAHQAGIALANLHLDLAQFSRFDFPRVDLIWEQDEWINRLDALIDVISSVTKPSIIDEWALKRARAQRDYLRSTESVHHYQTRTPRCLIHGDFHQYNLFFDEGENVVGIIDWDLVQQMPSSYEIARACLYMFQMDLAKSLAFIRGYMQINPLSKQVLKDGVMAWSVFADHHIWALEEVYLNGNKAAEKFIPLAPFIPYQSAWKPIENALFNQRNGLDNQGYIDNPYSVTNIQAPFQPLVDTVLAALLSEFPNQLHSIYLYGSVPRGNAIPYRSDLDLSVVFHQPLTPDAAKRLTQLSETLALQFPVVSKIDFDPGHVQEVMHEQEEYRWQFWLKHCCCCVWGDDLALNFRRYKPSVQIAWQLNEDLASVLGKVRRALDDGLGKAEAKVMAKKLLRSAYLLVAEKNGSWLNDLGSMAEVVRQFYPDDVTSIELTLALAKGEEKNVLCIIELIEGFGYKVVKDLQAINT
ncbi:phosphotransferase [Vibrio atypicus]|uniref:phosphotransferase n=1 Tax=Vibrio atypicus TaxID=558271 RepID=UPI00135923CF|nr:phosphotransferase [Vibrio atypicus]